MLFDLATTAGATTSTTAAGTTEAPTTSAAPGVTTGATTPVGATTTVCAGEMIDTPTEVLESFDISSPQTPDGQDATTPEGLSLAPNEETTIVFDEKPDADVEGVQNVKVTVQNVEKVAVKLKTPGEPDEVFEQVKATQNLMILF